MAFKTGEAWKGSLHEYLDIGDTVDDDIVDHFINVMPPAILRSDLIQMGEPYSHIGGRAVYATIARSELGWIYCGTCFRGETEDRLDG